MSGAIFAPLEGLGALDAAGGHPLVCPLCQTQYERPCLLDCFHDFCAGCLRGRTTDGRLACPLCQHQTVVKGPSGLPPVDRLLQFLVDSSGDGVEAVHCANCDLECSTQDAETTYFCNTCGQPLCARCREETHRARMFVRHDIVALGQHSRDVTQKCPLHSEPYIMFSTDKKSLLCIRCFGDMQGASRAHCVDLESAYVQGCERLDQAVLAVKARRRPLERPTCCCELCWRGEAQRCRGAGSHPRPLWQHAGQTGREESIAAAGCAKVHLVICSSFRSLASKAEFLDLGYELMERLQGVVTRPHRLRPAQSSKITSDHRAEFVHCLEPLLLLGPRRGVPTVDVANTLAGGSGPKVMRAPSCPSPVGKMSGSPVQKLMQHRSISTNVLLAEGEDTPFMEHCLHYEDAYRGLQGEVQNLKDQVQELHRDLTKHHSLIKAEIMGDILHRSLQLDTKITSEYASMEAMRAVFQEIWEESYQRVATEQEIYEAQLRDLIRLKQENACLTMITKQITPYIRSIAKVKERLEPRLQAPVDERSESPQNTFGDGRNGETPARNDPGSITEKREKPSEPKGSGWALSGHPEEIPLRNRDHLRPK